MLGITLFLEFLREFVLQGNGLRNPTGNLRNMYIELVQLDICFICWGLKIVILDFI